MSSFEVGSYPLVVISVPLMDIDFIKIKYCDIKTAICRESESSRPHTILNIPDQGSYQISVMTCLNKERSKTNTGICSSESTPYSFHQTHSPDPELDVLIAQSLESVSDYSKAGAKLYEAMEAFDTANKTRLFVARFSFGEDDQDYLDVWIDPRGGTDFSQPSHRVAGTDLGFDRIVLEGGSTPNPNFDEIRLGSTPGDVLSERIEFSSSL